MGNESLSHSKWKSKYHIVFATKYRRQIGRKKHESNSLAYQKSDTRNIACDHMSLQEYIKSFTGEPIKGANKRPPL